jgi:ribonuclease HIII
MGRAFCARANRGRVCGTNQPAQNKTFSCDGAGSAKQTWNAERRTSNTESRKLGVERWALSVERCPLEMNSYTHPLSADQAAKLRALLQELGFEFTPKEYTLFFAQKNKLSIAVYEKGPKVLIQGKGVEEFVQFELEPKILGEAKLGYEEVHMPEIFEPHFGIDESGKGDFFGPLVISGVYVDRGIARKFLEGGVQDSKRIGSDARIRSLAESIRRSSGGLTDTVLIGPEKYNQLYQKFTNLNSLLGWGHARVIENLLAKKPNCPRALSDQFADARVIEQSLLRHGRKITIEQRTRAESDVAVAAASILAREAFIDWLDKRGKSLGLRLERGVSASVKESAKKLVDAKGPQVLREVAKVHFRTAHEIAPNDYAAPVARPAWKK